MRVTQQMIVIATKNGTSLCLQLKSVFNATIVLVSKLVDKIELHNKKNPRRNTILFNVLF
jgi:hypothetical protein